MDDHSYEEYSGSARVNLENVQFIDGPVVGSSITSSNPANLPLRQAGYLQYNFTEQETKYFLKKIRVLWMILLDCMGNNKITKTKLLN